MVRRIKNQKVAFFVLILAAIALISAYSMEIFGSPETADNTSVSNVIVGTYYTSGPISGYATNITARIHGSSDYGRAKCAIYSYAEDGTAGVLLGYTEEKTITASGTAPLNPIDPGQINLWTFALVEPVYIEANTDYYFVIWSEKQVSISYGTDRIDASIRLPVGYDETFPSTLEGETRPASGGLEYYFLCEYFPADIPDDPDPDPNTFLDYDLLILIVAIAIALIAIIAILRRLIL